MLPHQIGLIPGSVVWGCHTPALWNAGTRTKRGLATVLMQVGGVGHPGHRGMLINPKADFVPW